MPPSTIFTPPPTHPVLSHFWDELQVSPPLPILPQSLSFPDYTRHMKQLQTVCTHSCQDTDNHSVSAHQLQLHECCDNDRNYTHLYNSCTSLTWNVSLTMQFLTFNGSKKAREKDSFVELQIKHHEGERGNYWLFWSIKWRHTHKKKFPLNMHFLFKFSK